MKKIGFVTLLLLFIFTASVSVSANSVLGNSLYTDVVTYINHYPIPSYNFNNNTLIAAEDLENYGFDVFWNEYSNTVVLTRNKEKNDISPLITFKPTNKQIGKKDITITTTETKVVTGEYYYTTYGGIAGKTLINVNELLCIDGTSVVWVPEVRAVKIWIEDGLEMRYKPFNVREFDGNLTYYKNCSGLDSWGHWQWCESPEALILTFAETSSEYSGIYTNCYGKLRILDVIDANGKSRLKNNYLYEYGNASLVPYAYGFTDHYLSHMIIIDNDDLYPNTASKHGGLIKFGYECSNGTWTETVRVDCLPYQ